MEPLLSVIVYGWRSIPELSARVDAVLTQAPSSIEVIIPVPTSTRSDAEHAIGAGRCDVRLVPARTERAATALNEAIAQSRGRFVAFLRTGDPWISRVAHGHAAFLDEHVECHAVASDCATSEVTLLTLIGQAQALHLHGAVFRRDVLVEAGMFDEGIRERYDVVIVKAMRASSASTTTYRGRVTPGWRLHDDGAIPAYFNAFFT